MFGCFDGLSGLGKITGFSGILRLVLGFGMALWDVSKCMKVLGVEVFGERHNFVYGAGGEKFNCVILCH